MKLQGISTKTGVMLAGAAVMVGGLFAAKLLWSQRSFFEVQRSSAARRLPSSEERSSADVEEDPNCKPEPALDATGKPLPLFLHLTELRRIMRQRLEKFGEAEIKLAEGYLQKAVQIASQDPRYRAQFTEHVFVSADDPMARMEGDEYLSLLEHCQQIKFIHLGAFRTADELRVQLYRMKQILDESLQAGFDIPDHPAPVPGYVPGLDHIRAEHEGRIEDVDLPPGPPSDDMTAPAGEPTEFFGEEEEDETDSASGGPSKSSWEGIGDQTSKNVKLDAGREPAAGTIKLRMPVEGKLGSRYGWRIHPTLGYKKFHYGVDIGRNNGKTIHSGGSGRVISAGWNGSCGIAVIVQHNSSLKSIHCHMSKVLVKAGQKVSTGTPLGKVGKTGRVTGPHLHYAMKRNNVFTNPIPYVSGSGVAAPPPVIVQRVAECRVNSKIKYARCCTPQVTSNYFLKRKNPWCTVQELKNTGTACGMPNQIGGKGSIWTCATAP